MTTKFKLHHDDHDITDPQLDYIKKVMMEIPPVMGFFIRQIEIPEELGQVPCGLYGPLMGDSPVDEYQVHYVQRGDRPWKDRILKRVEGKCSFKEPEILPKRFVDYVQVIGVRDYDCALGAEGERFVDGWQRNESDMYDLFTIFGGPLAPQHPEDPANKDVEAAKAFWAQHALVE